MPFPDKVGYSEIDPDQPGKSFPHVPHLGPNIR
jgi:hypothetical protein